MAEVELQPMTMGQLPLLLGWLAQPHVRLWWPWSAQEEGDLRRALEGTDPTRLWTITAQGRPVGMVQTYLFADEPQWTRILEGITDTRRAAGLDYLIGEAGQLRRGIGTAAIGLATERLLARPDVERVIVNVSVDNRASWRALENAGYRIAWTGELAAGGAEQPEARGPQHLLLRTGAGAGLR